jgi:hypothetical protein
MKAVQASADGTGYCSACFTGTYPVAVGARPGPPDIGARMAGTIVQLRTKT